jgi:adenosylmethionine-8-amino-7-oxononanoate aminotransferase
MTAGKGTTSGYVPFGFAAASGPVFEAVCASGFVHGFTWSHNALGAAAAHAVLTTLRDGGLVERSASLGERVRSDLRARLKDVAQVGDVRGLGMMVGIELVRDREANEPFSRGERITERVLDAARDRDLLLYSASGHVDGKNGDLLMLGPPFDLSDEEAGLMTERTAAAIRAVV